jgi:hypothetical protein
MIAVSGDPWDTPYRGTVRSKTPTHESVEFLNERSGLLQ